MNRPDTQEALALYDRFAATKFGAALGQEIWYQRYNQDTVTAEQWRELLGPDVNNLEHMRYTTELAAYYISQYRQHGAGDLTEDDEAALLIAAAIHDQGEVFDGDITYSEKTALDELNEQQKSLAAARQLLPGLDDDAYHRIAMIRQTIVFDKHSRLGKIFAVIEHMGYIQTALKAQAQVAHNPDVSDETRQGLQWLVADVLMNNFDGFADTNEDVVLARFIKHRRGYLTVAFAHTPSHIFDLYGDAAQTKEDKFARAQQHWQDMRKQYDPEGTIAA